MRLGYSAKAIDKEFSKFENRLHRVRLPYRRENEDRLREIISLGDGWREYEKEALEALWNLFEVI